MQIHLRAYINGNLGDDLFIRIITNRYPSHFFTIVGPKRYKDSFEDIKNLKWISSDKLAYKFITKGINFVGKIFSVSKLCYFNFNSFLNNKLSKLSELNVLISGSYFIEWNNDKQYLDYYYKNEIVYYKTRPYVIGINFGPYKTDTYKNIHNQLFEYASFLSVRDTKTYKMFEDLNPIYAPDIVFLYDGLNPSYHEEYFLTISVINYAKAMEGDYIDKMAEIIDSVVLKGLKVCLLSFCDAEGDSSTINQIIKKMKADTSDVKIIKYNEVGVSTIISIMKSSKYVIAGRYHSMILSWLLGLCTIPVCYSPKMENVILDIFPQSVYFNLDNISDLNFEDVIENITPTKLDSSIILQAEKHFEMLDERLKGKINE